MNFGSCDECCQHNLSSVNLGNTLVFIAIGSNFASCLGSLAIILLYISWKELRKGAQSIITYLAIADLCATISYFLGGFPVLLYDDKGRLCDSLCVTICQITAYMTFCSVTSSFLWTAILALHFCLLAVFNSVQLAEKLMPLYHVVAWGLPVLIGLVFLCTDTLANAPFVSGVWCFISAPGKSYIDSNIGIRVALKTPEFIGYCVLLVLYSASITVMTKKVCGSNIDLLHGIL